MTPNGLYSAMTKRTMAHMTRMGMNTMKKPFIGFISNRLIHAEKCSSGGLLCWVDSRMMPHKRITTKIKTKSRAK